MAVLVELALVVMEFCVQCRAMKGTFLFCVGRVDARCLGNVGANLCVLISVFIVFYFNA